MKVSFLSSLFSLLALLLFVGTAVSQNNVTDDDVNEVSKGLYCPVCESVPLDVCPTEACADWRELIRTQLESGMTEEQIYDHFATRFGDGVLAEPPRRGINLVLWLSPILALLVGGTILARTFRTLRTQPPTAIKPTNQPPNQPTIKPTNQYITQIEAELQEIANT